MRGHQNIVITPSTDSPTQSIHPSQQFNPNSQKENQVNDSSMENPNPFFDDILDYFEFGDEKIKDVESLSSSLDLSKLLGNNEF